MLVQKFHARTMLPAKQVLQKKAIVVCVLLDSREKTAKEVSYKSNSKRNMSTLFCSAVILLGIC